ncbi:MAG: efflux RND transporter periplasmic adaptor subunit [Puniceicoccales bacterium]|jgi:HlyD family secretion protein|nr:efflux RND transporter periplasmic adaptor subunit [Puniceicoccales bacterium]
MGRNTKSFSKKGHFPRATSKSNRKSLVLSVLAIALVFAALVFVYKKWGTFGTRSGGSTPADTSVTTITRRDMDIRVHATGNLKPMTEVIVGSELSGIVQEVFVQSNDIVEKGRPLAKLDTTKLVQQVENSRAALASAKTIVADAEATLRETTRNFERSTDLFKRSGEKIPSRAEMDAVTEARARATAKLDEASAGVQAAEAQLAIDENNLGKAVIKAPIKGVILSRGVEPGETVVTDLQERQLFIIAEDLRRMKLKVAVGESDIGKVAVGQDAEFAVDAYRSKRYRAKVAKVENASTVTDNVVTYTVELEVPNDDLTLRSGMTAQATIHVTGARNALLVPNSALNFIPANATPPPLTNGDSYVWRVEGNTAVPVIVKTGTRDAHFTEIISPEVHEGMKVLSGLGN